MADQAKAAEHLPSASTGAHHEVKDVEVGSVLMSTAILAICVALVYVVSSRTLEFLSVHPHDISKLAAAVSVPRSSPLPAEPRLEGIDDLEPPGAIIPQDRDWRQRRASEQERLDHYGWVDRASRIAHLPIQTAMQIAIDNEMFPVAEQTNNDKNRSNKSSAVPDTAPSQSAKPDAIPRSKP